MEEQISVEIPFDQLKRFLKDGPKVVFLRNSDFINSLAKGGDLDLLVTDMKEAEGWLISCCGNPLFRLKRSYVSQYFYLWGHIDLTPSVQWRGAMYLDNVRILQCAFQNQEGYWVLGPEHEAVTCWFASLAWGGFFKQRYADLIYEAANISPAEFKNALKRAVGKNLAEKLLDTIKFANVADSEVYASAVRRAIFAQAFLRFPIKTLRRHICYWLIEINLRIFPPTPWFVFLGPDGVGKSSLMDGIELRLQKHGLKAAKFHFRPMWLFARGGSDAVVSDPQAKPRRGYLASTLKIICYALDWFLGYWFRFVHLRAKGYFILFDRHYIDILVDPKRFRFGGSAWIARLLAYLIPKPNCFFVLEASVETIQKRKAEVPPDETQRQIETYHRTAKHFGPVIKVNANKNAIEVNQAVWNAMLPFYCRKSNSFRREQI